ncbi:MAG: hypothetical protein U0T73_01400 [Chitinophagales bacterium]
MDNNTADNSRKPGEMFTSSVLKRVGPLYQFFFAGGLAFLLLLISQFIFHSTDGVIYSACFGVVFYVMFNPWLCLLADSIRPYFLLSLALYAAIVMLMYGMVYLLTGLNPLNSFEIRLILMTTTFYNFVAYGMMSALKLLFINPSGGGL